MNCKVVSTACQRFWWGKKPTKQTTAFFKKSPGGIVCSGPTTVFIYKHVQLRYTLIAYSLPLILPAHTLWAWKLDVLKCLQHCHRVRTKTILSEPREELRGNRVNLVEARLQTRGKRWFSPQSTVDLQCLLPNEALDGKEWTWSQGKNGQVLGKKSTEGY